MATPKKWQILEKEIKQLSHAKWSKAAVAEKINGIDHDCVIHLKEDHYVIIEISKSNSLDKLRGDINRLSSARQYLFSQEIYSECYFVCEDLSELSSLRQTGDGHKVKVFSLKEFCRELYNYEKYNQIRKLKDFGSDSTDKIIDYIDVNYLSGSKNITISQMISQLKQGTNIVLTGDFGTGKSRCVRELFSRLSVPSPNGENSYPIAINLRDSWGTACYEDLISKHFISLGLQDLVDITFRLPDTSSLFFLLDGFDEIGTQTWGSDTEDIKYAKKASLRGVKDLIQKRKRGIFGSSGVSVLEDESLKNC